MLDYIVDMLDVNQYGGLRGLSTTHALVNIVHTWLLTAEERKASPVVLLDYRKAFDHVDHTVLVTKCKSCNLPNFIIRWLCAFPSDRSKRGKSPEGELRLYANSRESSGLVVHYQQNDT